MISALPSMITTSPPDGVLLRLRQTFGLAAMLRVRGVLSSE